MHCLCRALRQIAGQFHPSLRTPDRASSSTTCWMIGLRPTGSISLGSALVAGSKRVPNPATGTMALGTGQSIGPDYPCPLLDDPLPTGTPSRVMLRFEKSSNNVRMALPKLLCSNTSAVSFS